MEEIEEEEIIEEVSAEADFQGESQEDVTEHTTGWKNSLAE